MHTAPHCALVLPCRDEAPALPELLDAVPAQLRVIVVDNGSHDATAEVAREHGAIVVREERPGYGAAVHAGVLAAQPWEYVAVMDGDGSFDPNDVIRLLNVVESGAADLALGRRRPIPGARWPWHARLGNAFICWLMRRKGVEVRDIAPMRVCRTADTLALKVDDRRFGYPFELLRKAGEAQWRLSEVEVSYGPRAAGTRSKVSGSLRGTIRVARDLWRVMR